jgi:N-acetylmuramoyl-L-alanine amidase
MFVPTIRAGRLASMAWRRRSIAIPILLAVAITGSASGVSLIRIRPGDTLSAIALRYHTTVSRLVELNHLPGDGDLIYAGQTLRVPVTRTTTTSREVTIFHTVVVGDTLDGIAARYHVSPLMIARRNHLPSSLIVVLGTRLAIPHRVTTAHHTTTARPAGVSAAVAHERNALAHRAEPDQDQIDAIIRATSARYGLDPRLGLAVAWQESGWNMRVVSPVGAIGAMQVMPSTGEFLSNDVVHRHLDLGDAHDNITAGVALLSLLTHEASLRNAVAGYYQGLQSVRSHGPYSSTKHYVANVLALRGQYSK